MDNVRTSNLDFLKTELEVANAQNARLRQENILLRQKLESLTTDERSNSSLHVEAKLKAFQLEEERDRMYEKLEKIKRKYNQLHEAYIEKVKRCKALEDVFRRQKTLNGLVMRSALDQKQKEQEVAALQRQPSKDVDKQSVENLEAQVAKLQGALVDAHDLIDELEFELESVDFLEVENQRLRNELESHKKEKLHLRRASNNSNSHLEESQQAEERNANNTVDGDYDELPPYRPEDEKCSRYNLNSNASSLADSVVGELDPTTLERSVLTESLIKTVESESNCLRRELLRSRLQKTTRPSVRPTSSDA